MLGGDPSRLAGKRATPYDSTSTRRTSTRRTSTFFVEVDEIQPFVTEHARTFESYDDALTDLIDQYRRLIETWSRTADRYRASKPAVDFPRNAGRRAQRAYLDAVRDLAAPELGIRTSCASPRQNATRPNRTLDNQTPLTT